MRTLGLLAAGYVLMVWAFYLGRASAGEPGGVDVALGLLWRLLPLGAAAGLLAWFLGLLWLDFCRRSWAAAHLPSEHLPSEEGITEPSRKAGR